MVRFADYYAERATPSVILSRDRKEMLIKMDCRDTSAVKALLENHTFSPDNEKHLLEDVIVANEIRIGLQSPYVGVFFRHGEMKPSTHQVKALQYALEAGTWFENPRGRLFNRNTVIICAERGWLAEDGKELRITAEGKRMLRCARLDEEDARQAREQRRLNRERRRGRKSLSDV